jgi:hypothetical protein
MKKTTMVAVPPNFLLPISVLLFRESFLGRPVMQFRPLISSMPSSALLSAHRQYEIPLRRSL